jgi:hypothetical protein
MLGSEQACVGFCRGIYVRLQNKTMPEVLERSQSLNDGFPFS